MKPFLFVCFLPAALASCHRSPSAATSTQDSSAGTLATGVAPAAPFPAPHGPRAYVSNEASGDLSVIDLASRQVVATIPVGKRPRGVQRSPDGRWVYVALSGSVAAGPGASGPTPPADKSADAIGIVDTTSGVLVGRLPSGSDPEQFALSRDGSKLYVSNEDAASVSIVDVARKTVDGTVPVREEPEGVALSPDGKWVYVTCESAAAVMVIDAESRAVVNGLKVGPRPRGAVFLPDSTKAYVTSEMSGTIAVVSLPQHQVFKTLVLEGTAVRPMGLAVAPDGKRVYVTTGHGGMVFVIDTTTDAVSTSIRVGKRPWGVAVSGDGKTLYTANGLSDDVSVVDTASAAETGRIKVGSKPWGIVVVP